MRSTEMASTSCLGPASPPYPHIMYYNVPPEPSGTPERDIVSTQNRQSNVADLTDDESDHSSEDEVSLNTFTGEAMSETELTPILFKPSSRLPMPTARRKDVPTPAPTLDRRRLRAGHRMADATRLNSQVANRVVKYARCIRNMYESEMGCLNCGLLPLCPITGQCGHTRCTEYVSIFIFCLFHIKFFGMIIKFYFGVIVLVVWLIRSGVRVDTRLPTDCTSIF